ncbi:MAG: fibronectin type III domain-containing protein [Bacteroidales bacterium]|nr:fibronectin type III domain-containing protein [Bacteroidales bacterium]
MRFKMFFMAMLTTSLIAMSAAAPALAGTYIKDVKVIGGTESEVNALKSSLTDQGWKVINRDLNAGAGGDFIYLLYLPEDNSDGINHSYVSDFYISNSEDSPDKVTHDGRNYYRVSYDGGSDFVSKKGDLNCNAKGDYIYLYYTRAFFGDNQAVTDISFNDTQSGAVGVNGGSTGYNLNNNAGGKYIYMHFSTEKLASGLITIGTRESTDCKFPFNTTNGTVTNSRTQQIYRASEIGSAGIISSIMFDYASDGPYSFSDVEIYLVHTDRIGYSITNRYFVQCNESDKVYEGTVSASGPGWLIINLDSAFEYDGNSNLMVHCQATVKRGSWKHFGQFADPDNQGWCCSNNTGTDLRSIKNNIQLIMISDYYSMPENLSVSSITNHSANVSWSSCAEATGYVYKYRRAGTTTWSEEQTVSSTSVMLDGLASFGSYDFRVRAMYGNNFSNYASVGFKTPLTGTAAKVRGETKYVTTFYDRSAKYELPDGALAYTAAPDGNKMVFYQFDRIIPSGTAVIILSDKADIQLTQTDASATYNYPNILQGSDMPVSVSGGKVDGKAVYVFGIDKGKLGFYQFSGTQVPPGTAYYLAQ